MKHRQQSKRATFEDVGAAQDKLRVFVDECIEQNKILNEKEREYFIRLFREATLGFGANHKFTIESKNKSYSLLSVGHAANWIAYQMKTPISMRDGEQIDIKMFWWRLRDELFTIFDEAIHLSVKISQEQIKMGVSQAAEV